MSKKTSPKKSLDFHEVFSLFYYSEFKETEIILNWQNLLERRGPAGLYLLLV